MSAVKTYETTKSYVTRLSIKLAKVIEEGDKTREIARAFLYVMNNGHHDQPFGLMEDVFVDEEFRGQGIGTELINEVIALAKEEKCYKLIATSRYEREHVHKLYKELGFADHGKEFRMDL